MNYETIDWQLEAARIEAAFNLGDECCFMLCEKREGSIRWEESWVLWHPQWMDELPLPEIEGAAFSCEYHPVEGKSFYLGNFNDLGASDDGECMAAITFDWKGNSILQARNTAFAPHLAKGLFHLGLLTREVEAMLQVTVTAHQKMEWKLEYEARNRF